MDREEAIRIGTNMLEDKRTIDIKDIVRKFVNILYDANNSETRDEDMYSPSGNGDSDYEQDLVYDYPEPKKEDWMHSEINTLRGHFGDVMNKMDLFVTNAYEPEDYTEPEPEPRIVRLKKRAITRLPIMSEWLEECEDGTFNRFASVIRDDGVEVVTMLTLISYNEGKQVEVGYGEVNK